MSIKNYPEFKKIQEDRRKKVCPVLTFKPVRESEIYKDMIAMGFEEVIADNQPGVENIGPAENRYHKDRMGNIGFYHEGLLTDDHKQKGKKRYFNICFKGTISDTIVGGRSLIHTTKEPGYEFPRISTDLTQKCMTIDDYFFKMGFLIKYLLLKKGVDVTDDELYSRENYKDLIRRKMEENPEIVKNFEIPPSLRGEDLGKGANILKRFGGFDD